MKMLDGNEYDEIVYNEKEIIEGLEKDGNQYLADYIRHLIKVCEELDMSVDKRGSMITELSNLTKQ